MSKNNLAAKLAARKNKAALAHTAGSNYKELSVSSASVTLPCGGQNLKFESEIIAWNKIEADTYVDSETNPRPQELVLSNIKALEGGIARRGQLAPAYGFINHKDGPIEIIDGSRRRQGCKLAEENFWVMVCDLTQYDFFISNEDKLQLAKDLSTAKEESLYDFGVTCLRLKADLKFSKKVAEHMGCSESKVSKATKAASVPVEILSLFDDYTVLSLKQFETLRDSTAKAIAEETPLDEFIQQLEPQVKEIDATDSDDQAQLLVKLIAEQSGVTKRPRTAANAKNTVNYMKDVTKPQFRAVRNSFTTSGRFKNEQFHLRDAPAELIEEIDKLIKTHATKS
ncbi:hypothetical protein A6E01_18860 (plasmid) [Vibrio breoganii]|uniref:ParB-like N-terminal domain-containing protein n=1 Tax=Vibrio breoganii TaxID=553239 RepID=A0AAN1CUP4_9VIBR|nr:ParB N-terminal domain-containing protein [Vibrio breoganii]ANO35662.1 hypothetical protein A6E01_18860 [Vibrio breoganii]